MKIATFIAACSLSAFATDYAAFVNPRIGTSGFGHTTVAAAYPLGMVQAGPDTGTEGWDYASGYRDEDRRIVGFSQNHLSGTGVPELGDLLILPFSNSHSNFNSKLAETATPGYYAVTLESGIRCEATVSQRAAVWRFTYPQGSRARLLVDMQWGLVWEKMSGHVLESSWTDGGANALSGWARTKGWTERVWNFALETDSPRVALEELPRSASEKGSRLVLDFGDVRTLTVRVALSTTTEDGARRNLAEVRGKSFEEVFAAARAAWDRYLSRVELPGEEGAVATNVYTALYHLFYQPSDITDVDGSYRGADGKIAKVEKGHRYFSTLSLWDTYRAAHPLYTILAPELVDDFVRTMIAHRRAAGYLPVWPVWGQETHCMIGNHAVPVLCEAVNKGLTTVPAEEVYAAIRATLRENHPGKLKEDWAILDKYGYYPFDLVPEEGVSRTVEGAYDDWCAAQLAKRLGHEEDEKFFRRRSGAWRNVFDPATKSMRGRASDGSWRTPFDPSALFGYEVPRDISEANANQYAWHVQQDASALAEAMGGKSAALAKLEEHFDRRRAPHGAVADVTGLIGEYAHGNEPGHHVPYLFSLWGRPERTAEIVREIFDRFYLAKPDGLCGNDDCGQMSAWYLFSAMGFYPVEPTEGRFVYGAPQVREMRLHVGGGRTFAMRANGLSETAKYVRRVSLPSLSWRDVANGGELVFEMSERPFDVVVVGGTSAGIAAAVQATRMGARTVVLEATQRIGGMTTGGLGQTDIGDTSAFRGLARQFYRDVKSHYDDPKSWRWQKKEQYRPNGQTAGSSDGETMWTFEPSAALAVLEAWERKEGLRVERGAALDRSGVETEGGRIVSVRTKDGRVWRGDVFIDATYEGDLMAAAGVSYRVGREANSEYGETLNGLQRAGATKHQILPGVSAYKVAGDPASGLLPGVEAKDDERADGEGDKRVQAYCYRLCLTDVPGNRIPFAKPEGYDEADYELLLRNAERTPEDTVEHWRHQPWNNSPMPNRKTDTNNRTGVSMDFIGGSWRWAEATDDERGRIAAQHERWQRGALWTLANNPRVPAYVRNEVSKWGLCKDEFTENGGWPTQLYVREARRMVGEYVMTEANCRGRRVAERPVAYAAYTMDSHHVRRYADADGFVRNEGDVQDKAGVKGPYPIDYGAIVPKRGECANLLVPICLSATHIAYGSIRMEPVFFATGQAAGAAAALASKENCAVQDVGYAALSDSIDDIAAKAVSDARAFAERTAESIGDGQLRQMFVSAFLDTIARTVLYRQKNGRDDTFVVTGDIPAMWLRDSCAQVWPYVQLAAESVALRSVIRGVLNRAFACVRHDPYANAFNDGPGETMWQGDFTAMTPELHERKWEIDSLAYPLRLAHGYWQATHDATAFGAEWLACVRTILSTLRERQAPDVNGVAYTFKRPRSWENDQPTKRRGRPCGLVASAFRPSDDACALPFNIPGNVFAADALGKAAEIVREACGDDALADECAALSREIAEAVAKFGIVEHPEYGRIYAYEVDGTGDALLIDDANAPSLLSLPYLCRQGSFDAGVYGATRRFVLSEANPWFFRGSKGEGVGSAHTGVGRIWPLAVAMRALTSADRGEIAACVAILRNTTGGALVMHESFAADDDSDFTRGWFAWADGVFAEAVMHAIAKGALEADGAATLAKIKANVVASLTEGRGRLPELRESLASCGADTGDSTVKAVIESVCPPSAEEVAKYVATLGADGRWPDVDYRTVTRSAWPVRDHLRRMKAIARVPHTAESVAAFRLALGAWLRGGFRNPNWWWNEIGVPLELGAACLAMDGELTESERAAVVERLRESKIGMTGQNRIWVAECVLYRALLEGNSEDARAAREAIVGEVKTSDTAEGIQADWSFHQHGNQPQFGNYGASYIMSVPRLLRFFDGTPWAAPEDKMEIMRKLVANGFLPTVWRGSMDVGAIGRQLGRGAARMKGAAVLLAAEELGIDASVAPGLHWFHKSAMGEYRAEGWMAGVKCQTAKVQGTEKVNEDNLLGAHLADGALFCYATGDEYRDIFPFWNWRHVPGTTSYDIGEVDWKNDNKADVCVAEGDVVRFELDRAGLKARTTWRFSPSGVEVEVADVAAASGLPVVTTVEQSVAQANAAWRREGDGIVAVNGAFRYDLPSNAVVRVERRKGNWKRHMGAMPDAEVEGDVFEITIPHGVDPSGASCRWKVRPTH